MNQSQEINELVKALSKAQAQMKGAKQDSKNPHFKSDYADLTSVWTACKGALTDEGLAIMQTIEYVESKILLVTTLAHSSGQWIKSFMPVMAVKMDPQGIGSALTYARRYALAAMVGVCPEDDDGETAMGRVEKEGLSDKDKQHLMSLFEEAPELKEKFREKLNLYDLTQMSRKDFVKTIEFFEKRSQNKKGGKNAKRSMDEVA
ncbi:MAG: ERF family protein [Bacteroidales bacterium]